MGWKGELHLDYRIEGGRLRAVDRHVGPLRVLKAHALAQPNGCEHVLVHPPGGVAGGDELAVHLTQGAGTHVRITTPGATRFYRTRGEAAAQRVDVHLERDALLEWLPLETIAHGGCMALNRLQATLEPGARMIGWDIACLGLPASGDTFDEGVFEQHLEITGLWLEQGRIRAEDRLLRDSAVGLQGHPVWATMWCAAGQAWSEAEREALLEPARALEPAPGVVVQSTSPHARVMVGSTSPHPQVVVLRALADRVEPVLDAFRALRRAWYGPLGLGQPDEPRIWKL